METKTCCFIGHRKIEKTDELILSLSETLIRLIEKEGVRTFAFGSRSEFNDLCHNIVTDLQKQFNGLERVFVNCRNEACFLENEKEKLEKVYSKVLKRDVHLQTFEREIEHKTKYTSGKAAYVERNYALIDMSDFCLFYFDKDYMPQQRKSVFKLKSGTAIAYAYAAKKKKQIINIFKA